MQNKFTYLIIFFIASSALGGCSKNETGEEYIYELGILFKHDRETFKLHFDNKNYTPIEMIGWSRDGLFAYRYRSFDANIFRNYKDFTSPSAEQISEFPAQYSFVIMNTITNEIIEKDSIAIGNGIIGIVEKNSISYLYDKNEHPDSRSNARSSANLQEILESYKTKWEALLKKYNIAGSIDDLLVNNFQTNLLDFPIDDYSCWFDYVIKSDKHREDIIQWKLMIGNNVIQKIIGENDDGVREDQIIGRKILGYYKNPYENSIVVVLNYYRYTSYSEADTLWGTLNVFSFNIDNIKLSR